LGSPITTLPSVAQSRLDQKNILSHLYYLFIYLFEQMGGLTPQIILQLNVLREQYSEEGWWGQSVRLIGGLHHMTRQISVNKNIYFAQHSHTICIVALLL